MPSTLGLLLLALSRTRAYDTLYVVLTTNGATCTSAGLTPIASVSECDTAVAAVNAANGKSGVSNAATIVTLSIRPSDCFSVYVYASSGYRYKYFNTRDTSHGTSTSDEIYVFCRNPYLPSPPPPSPPSPLPPPPSPPSPPSPPPSPPPPSPPPPPPSPFRPRAYATLLYVVLTADGATCASAGLTPIASAFECDTAVAAVNAANGKPGAVGAAGTEDWSFRPSGCQTGCLRAPTGYFCQSFNTDVTSHGTSTSDSQYFTHSQQVTYVLQEPLLTLATTAVVAVATVTAAAAATAIAPAATAIASAIAVTATAIAVAAAAVAATAISIATPFTLSIDTATPSVAAHAHATGPYAAAAARAHALADATGCF